MGANRARVALFLLGLLTGPIARGQTPQEKQRSDILNELGLKKKPPVPPAEVAPPPAETAPAEAAKPGAAGGKSKATGKTGAPAGPAAPSFTRAIHPQLLAICKACHSPVGPAAGTRLLFTGEPAADHRAIVRFVDVHTPEASIVLAKVGGTTIHAGGAPWPPASAPYQRLLAWIRGGARSDAGAAAAPVAEPPAPAGPTARRAPPAGTSKAPSVVETPGPAAAPPVEAPPLVPAPVPPVVPSSPVPSPAVPSSPAPASVPTGPSFATAVHPILMGTCSVCHRPGAPAAMTRLLLSGDEARDEAVVRTLVDPAAPERSLLVTKASGQMHGGGAVLPPSDPRLATMLDWIQGLAAPAAVVGPGAAPATAARVPAPAIAPPPMPSAPPGPPPFGAPLALPGGFMLDGRFSLDYERRHFTGDPFATGSVNALRSYHHFLFLSRDLASDPCGLAVEVLTLQFWEAHCRVGRLPSPLRLTVAGGKIVVPFGADPLYHQNYGGLGGFDQPVLPVIWAVEGAAAHLVVERRGFVVTDDLFVVRGFTLPHADSIINLQSGFSTEDATRLGFGNRVGVAWMFASAWYSAYYNPLPFGRRLFMQAFDVALWRPRGVPVLGHFSLGAGFLRADVSGGGPGVGGVGYDYYDFADYLQLRYYPFDWLYIQYRSGLRTFNNRRGVVIDNTRLTDADASTHNFAIVARCLGLTAGLYYFINLEKVDELANDLIRLSVIYEF